MRPTPVSRSLLIALILVTAVGSDSLFAADTSAPIVGPDLAFAERDGLVAVEAEHFVKQSQHNVRAFHITTTHSAPILTPDGDPAHLAGASGGAYIEILPDTRRNHSHKLVRGENFSNDPGKMAVVTYNVHVSTPGRYYVWARAFSSGSEDNGLHVGIDGMWPESGQRLQWCAGKNTWRWESKQRTEAQHCGEPHRIYLDVAAAGVHQIHFSMREDGFEFDRWLMTRDRDFIRPDDVGPASVVHAGKQPEPFPWVAPAAVSQSNDAVSESVRGLVISAAEFDRSGSHYYLDRDRWLAIDPDKHRQAEATIAFPHPDGMYRVVLQTVGENDGQSSYQLQIGDKSLAAGQSPLSDMTCEESARYRLQWPALRISQGDAVRVSSTIGSSDGQEFSRARWSALIFLPADAKTRQSVKRLMTSFPVATAATRIPTPDPISTAPLVLPRQPDGDGAVQITGELKQWHKVTLTLNGPYAHEQDKAPNPYVNHEMTVRFTHESGTPAYVVPAYFAADGNAAESSADSGTSWRAHLAPDLPGRWDYEISFLTGTLVVETDQPDAQPVTPYHGSTGSFDVAETDKDGRDFRHHGRLQYVGERYLRFAGSKEYFLKAGPDAPETLLAFVDFDNTVARKSNVPLKTWQPHAQDWRDGDPTWQNGRGKGLIGAVNYIAEKGCNVISFLPYNAGGDGDNVWPFVARNSKLHYDCSKLDQWGIVFDHATSRGVYLHFKLQENEIDDDRRGQQRAAGGVPESLDGGRLGPERRLYIREIIARFGHALALNWNLGEENTQSTQEQVDMIQFLKRMDPYDHNVVVHTFPSQQDRVYTPLLGKQSGLTGASLQNSWSQAHQRTLKWIRESVAAGHPWVVCNDEQNPASDGVPPDPGYEGHSGIAQQKDGGYTRDDIRKRTLWGTLLAGGAGVEYYFGYKLPQNDLICEDYRSRDSSWDYCRIALQFFRDHSIPFHQMQCADQLVGNKNNDNSRYCFAKLGELYLVYLPEGGSTKLDLNGAAGTFTIKWFNPRAGGPLQGGSVKQADAGSIIDLGSPPADANEDWLIVVGKK